MTDPKKLLAMKLLLLSTGTHPTVIGCSEGKVGLSNTPRRIRNATKAPKCQRAMMGDRRVQTALKTRLRP